MRIVQKMTKWKHSEEICVQLLKEDCQFCQNPTWLVTNTDAVVWKGWEKGGKAFLGLSFVKWYNLDNWKERSHVVFSRRTGVACRLVGKKCPWLFWDYLQSWLNHYLFKFLIQSFARNEKFLNPFHFSSLAKHPDTAKRN